MPSFPHLTPEQQATFAARGWLHLRGVLSTDALQPFTQGLDRATRWAELGGPGLHHHEATDHGPVLARSEDLVPHDATLRAAIQQGPVAQWVGELFGEEAVLYKEKINHKHPGGGGFAPHQDASAYRFVDHHISVMVPIDPATEANGTLSFAERPRAGLLPMDAGHRILPEVADALSWQTLELSPGDVLLFDSYTPHRSGTNTTQHPRRAFYLTYNAASKGDWRETYYADKRAEFAAQGHAFRTEDGQARARISVNDDFLGKAVSAADTLPDLFARYTGERAHALYDEAVTELQHAEQCAAWALQEGQPDTLIAAALLHDVGHLLIGDLFPLGQALPKDFKHEEVGARYLARWFGPEVTEPVRLHVAAKRYLVATDPAYASTLSASSVRSMAIQGGPMSASEIDAFESNPWHADAVRLRRYDDRGKDDAAAPAAFASHHDRLRALVTA